MSKVLQVKDLQISFRTINGTVKAVRNISFDLNRGETLAIVGESGSGKSVTSKAIIGILAGNSIVEGGEILYDGKDLLKIAEDDFHKIRGDKIAMIFQDPLSSLNPIMKIGQQLTEAMILKAKSSRKNSRAVFNSLLKKLKVNVDKVNSDNPSYDSKVTTAKIDEFDKLSKDVMKALNKLTDGFDDVQKEFAQGFLDDAMKGLSQGFTQEIEKINAEAEKLRVVLYRLSTMEMSEGIAKGLAEEFERAADKVADLQSALKRALSGADSVDASGIVKLREELEQAKQAMVELGKKKIELDCQETIARVEKLRNEVENLDDVLNKLGGVDAISRIKEDFENGAMSVEKATSALKKYNDTLDKVENNSKNVGKSFDAFESAGSKIEGVFGHIQDGFQRFTFGELLEEGIESAIMGIKDTILGLDEAMTELKRVAPDDLKFDDVGYKQIANDAREVAMSVGQSTEDVIKT